MDENSSGGPAQLTEQQRKQIEIHVQEQKEETATPFGESGPPPAQVQLEKTRRAEIQTDMTAQEEERLKKLAAPEPDFEILTDAQVASLKKKERKAYRAKLEAYQARRAEWEENSKIKYEGQKMSIRARQLGDTWPRIEATPETMDLSLQRNELDAEGLKEVAEAELTALQRSGGAKAVMYLQQYMSQTSIATGMNSYLRGNSTGMMQGMCKLMAEGAKAGLARHQITHDMVTRRGVGHGALAGMMGLNKSPEEAKQALKKMLDAGQEVVLEEKGFCSTSVRADKGYAASGIEFIILCRKGTSAIDFSEQGSWDSEKELLINAGTKFRVVKAFFNDGTPGSQRDVLMGNQESWKIYLETIPQGDANGVEQ